MKYIFLFLSTTFFISCGAPKLVVEKSDHFDGERFFNPGQPNAEKGFWDLLLWRIKGNRREWPEWVDIKQQKVAKSRVDAGEMVVTFINHATVLIQLDGVNILTDPLWALRVSPVSWIGPKRVKDVGVKFEDLPKIDAVLISHNHFDHFNIETIDRLVKRDNPKIIAGLGSSYYLSEDSKKEVVELDWQQTHRVGTVEITYLPSQHWSKRTFSDRNMSLWGSFAIVGSHKIYFAGDAGYDYHFSAAQEQFTKFDLALLPIGAYRPQWFMKRHHLNPQEALIAHYDLKADLSIGIHHGTFQLSDEGIDEPIKDLNKALEADRQLTGRQAHFIILENGESHFYP